jgi:hypothetical protein
MNIMEDLSNEILAENLGATYKSIMLNIPAASAPVFLARLIDLTTLSTAKIALRPRAVKVKS